MRIARRLPLRVWRAALLFLVLLWELWKSSIAVARAVLSREASAPSAIVAVPLSLKTDAGIVTLANCITLTPGTTSLHVATDRRTLYVHALDAPNAQATVAAIKETFEDRIRRIEE